MMMKSSNAANTTAAALLLAEAALNAAWRRACAATARDAKRNREATAAVSQWAAQARESLAVPFVARSRGTR